ncbi:MAG: DUF4968 domain-containing protein, partial [Propionibacterium sp.]|nr:DUF4968 domain-containing protein [Propionibacterium sp.]
TTSPLADHASQVVGPTYRITVLTERLVRFEYSPSGRFEDRATQVVVNRDFPTPEFTVARSGDAVRIITSSFQLSYDGTVPSATSLEVSSGASYHGVWRPGEPPSSKYHEFLDIPTNLGGTARTLDCADGATPLEPGILSTIGPVELDDSASLALTDDGWVAQREPGTMDVYLFCYDHDYPAAIRDFYRLTGPQPMLPRFALGNWWSRYHRYTQDEYQGLIEEFEQRHLPFSVAVIDMDWHLVDIDPKYGHGWTGYTWNRELFPDHVGFLRWLHDKGLKVSLNVHPADGIRAHEDAYPALARAMGIDPASELPVAFDIADPDFVAAYFDLVHHPLEDDGVDFWWLDWQQGAHSGIPGLDPLWMLNHLHFLDSARTGRRPLTFSRYAGPGSHRYPVGFSGDTVISWDSLEFQPYFTATASNIGYGWWSHDIGGHMFGYKDDELATRWVQLGAFSPVNRLHSTQNVFNGKEPWRFNEVAERVQGDFLRFRHRLVPYLYTMNERAHSQGEPLVRPIYWTPGAPVDALHQHGEFWFGTEMIVAAITRPADTRLKIATARAWLPEGNWVDLFTGLVYDGGRTVSLHRRLEEYPVFVRAGGIVPLTGPDDLRADRNPGSLELVVAGGADGDFTLYEDDDAAAPRAARTRISFDWSDGTLVVHPLEGDADVMPDSREVTATFVGVAPVGADHPSSYDPRTGRLSVQLGRIDPRVGATVRFDAPLRLHDNQVASRLFAWLDRAEIGFSEKESIWTIVSGTASALRKVAELRELGLDPLVFAAVAEIVEARA